MAPAEISVTDAQVLKLTPAVKAVARQLLGPASRYQTPEDLEQDGWLALCQARSRYTGQCSFKTFTALRLRGAMIDGLRQWDSRHRGGKRRVEWYPLPRDLSILVDAAPSTLDRLLNTERHLLLARALDRLSQTDRQLLDRHYTEGVSWADMARERGCTKSWVQQQARRALTRLRKTFP